MIWNNISIIVVVVNYNINNNKNKKWMKQKKKIINYITDDIPSIEYSITLTLQFMYLLPNTITNLSVSFPCFK